MLADAPGRREGEPRAASPAAPPSSSASAARELDLLVCGSRGYGPLRSVLVGGVSGRLMRSAHCPVIVVPRGIEPPLASLFEGAATTA